MFDTAQAYGFGRSERLLGRALAADLRTARESVVIATKGGLRMDGDRLVRDTAGAQIGMIRAPPAVSVAPGAGARGREAGT